MRKLNPIARSFDDELDAYPEPAEIRDLRRAFAMLRWAGQPGASHQLGGVRGSRGNSTPMPDTARQAYRAEYEARRKEVRKLADDITRMLESGVLEGSEKTCPACEATNRPGARRCRACLRRL